MQFSLVYTSLLLKISILQYIGLKDEKIAYEELIKKSIIILDMNEKVASFLKLLYNLEEIKISINISVIQ